MVDSTVTSFYLSNISSLIANITLTIRETSNIKNSHLLSINDFLLEDDFENNSIFKNSSRKTNRKMLKTIFRQVNQRSLSNCAKNVLLKFRFSGTFYTNKLNVCPSSWRRRFINGSINFQPELCVSQGS